jgi:hypothetical protein
VEFDLDAVNLEGRKGCAGSIRVEGNFESGVQTICFSAWGVTGVCSSSLRRKKKSQEVFVVGRVGRGRTGAFKKMTMILVKAKLVGGFNAKNRLRRPRNIYKAARGIQFFRNSRLLLWLRL